MVAVIKRDLHPEALSSVIVIAARAIRFALQAF
jgi:hypothetical protein